MNVKSAIRVIEVLEFFDSVQREASLSEIARVLGCWDIRFRAPPCCFRAWWSAAT